MSKPEFAAFEAIPDAIIVVGRDGSIVHSNVHADRLFGYEDGRLVGLTIDSLIPEQFFAKPTARPMGRGRELQALKSDGRKFPVEIAIGPTDNGKATVAVIRDISAIMKTRDMLRDLDESFENAPIGLCCFDKELRYLRINKWLARINGLSVEEHVGRKIADVLPDVALGVEEQLRHVLQTGESIVGGLVEATTPAHPTTTRTYMHNYSPDRSANGAVVSISCVVQDVTEARKDLKDTLAEIKELKNQLQAEGRYLMEEIKADHDFELIIGNSAAIMTTLYKVEQVAATDASVLLLGETGTGKELLARAIHAHSERNGRPLIKVDCTTLPPELVESELFGHEKGAFTGAYETKPGRFELADGGTMFLDEIGDLPLELQSKLLRVVQDGEFQRLGAKRVQRVDVRVISATNRDLKEEMRAGRFRSDLFYRIGVFPIDVPPLRDRMEDLPLLASFFVSKLTKKLGKKVERISRTTMDTLMAYDWPGNIRELHNVIERSLILSPGRELELRERLVTNVRRPSRQSAASLSQDLRRLERKRILEALEASGWKVKGDGNAASCLRMKPSSLQSRMKSLGIERPNRRTPAVPTVDVDPPSR